MCSTCKLHDMALLKYSLKLYIVKKKNPDLLIFASYTTFSIHGDIRMDKAIKLLVNTNAKPKCSNGAIVSETLISTFQALIYGPTQQGFYRRNQFYMILPIILYTNKKSRRGILKNVHNS